MEDIIPSPSGSFDSLFDSEPAARRTAPPIPGLFFPPNIRIPPELANKLMEQCMDLYFKNPSLNQVMLFERIPSSNGFPPFLVSLLSTLESILQPILPPDTHSLLFPSQSTSIRVRQVILNLYNPGEGITPHVDLLQRFGDGILGLSLGSGCVMRFRKVPPNSGLANSIPFDEYWDLYLPERSLLILSGEARYDWTHGIDAQMHDLVQCERDENEEPTMIARGVGLSLTFRWLLPGADIGGNDND
jgi:2OG-Fe(II) oxygenase superfamily